MNEHQEIQIARIDIIIKELERGRNAAPGMMHSWFTGVIVEMEKLKEEEL